MDKCKNKITSFHFIILKKKSLTILQVISLEILENINQIDNLKQILFFTIDECLKQNVNHIKKLLNILK